jgi:C1A family cysteine protease
MIYKIDNLICFHSWKAQQGLVFATPEDRKRAEEALALQLNQTAAQNQNFAAGTSSSTEAVNPAFLTPDLNTGFIPPARKKRQTGVDISQCSNPPVSRDWTKENRVSAVQNQIPCASSYIFAGIGALESAVAIAKNTAPTKLSEQYMLGTLKIQLNSFWLIW